RRALPATGFDGGRAIVLRLQGRGARVPVVAGRPVLGEDVGRHGLRPAGQRQLGRAGARLRDGALPPQMVLVVVEQHLLGGGEGRGGRGGSRGGRRRGGRRGGGDGPAGARGPGV